MNVGQLKITFDNQSVNDFRYDPNYPISNFSELQITFNLIFE